MHCVRPLLAEFASQTSGVCTFGRRGTYGFQIYMSERQVENENKHNEQIDRAGWIQR